MNQTITDPSPTPNAAGALLASVVNTMVGEYRPQRMLLINGFHGSLPGLDISKAASTVKLVDGNNSRSSDVACHGEALPFEDQCFNMIIIHHAAFASDGDTIEEVHRVLSGGGILLIIGRGRLSLASGSNTRSVPRFSPLSVCRILRQHGYLVEQCDGIGLLKRPVHWSKRWQLALLPMFEHILIVSRKKRNKPSVTPLRFNHPQTVGVRSAALDGLNREAV